MSVNAIINKYRPGAFDEVLGQDAVMRALDRALSNDSHPHAYLLTGPSGVGKTTTARIIGSKLGAEIFEIDAASNSSVDDMRVLVEQGNYRSLYNETGRRLVIIDECHALSKAAWQPLLKSLEEPADFLYYCLCTTEQQKVPETILTRCYHIKLKPLSMEDLEQLLIVVSELEGWDTKGEILNLVMVASQGSARKALTLLEACHDAPSLEEAKRIIDIADDNNQILEICRLLITKSPKWPEIQVILNRTDEDLYENALGAMTRYFIKVMQTSSSAKDVKKAYDYLEACLYPSNTFDRKAAFFGALGRMLLIGEQ